MNKILKLLFINILLILGFMILFDLVYSYTDYNLKKKDLQKMSKIIGYKDNALIQVPPYKYSLKHISFKTFYKNASKKFKSLKRISKITNSTKNSIIIFGCSFAEGAWLDDKEIFSSQLSKLTNRTVYNRGYSGTGPAALVYQTKNELLYDYIETVPEYAIYIFIPNHFFRTYMQKYGSVNLSNIPYIGYKEKNGGLEEDYSLINNINRLTFPRKLIEQYQIDYICKNPDIAFDFVMLHFIEAQRELKKRYPNIKFLILKHPHRFDLTCIDVELYNSQRWNILKKENILVYDLKNDFGIDVYNKEFSLPDSHPSAKLWEVVSKKLQNELNL